MQNLKNNRILKKSCDFYDIFCINYVITIIKCNNIVKKIGLSRGEFNYLCKRITHTHTHTTCNLVTSTTQPLYANEISISVGIYYYFNFIEFNY